jgi:hypothetical protein
LNKEFIFASKHLLEHHDDNRRRNLHNIKQQLFFIESLKKSFTQHLSLTFKVMSRVLVLNFKVARGVLLMN